MSEILRFFRLSRRGRFFGWGNIKFNYWAQFFKSLDFVFLRFIFNKKFSLFFLKSFVFFLKCRNIMSYLFITYLKLRIKTFIAFHYRFPHGLRLGTDRYGITIKVDISNINRKIKDNNQIQPTVEKNGG